MRKFGIIASITMLMFISIISGCKREISGEMVTKGRVVFIGFDSIVIEQADAKSYIKNIANIQDYSDRLSDAKRTEKNIGLSWKLTGDRFQSSNILNIEME